MDIDKYKEQARVKISAYLYSSTGIWNRLNKKTEIETITNKMFAEIKDVMFRYLDLTTSKDTIDFIVNEAREYKYAKTEDYQVKNIALKHDNFDFIILDKEEIIKVFLTLKMFYHRLYESQDCYKSIAEDETLALQILASGIATHAVKKYTPFIKKLYDAMLLLLRFAKISKKKSKHNIKWSCILHKSANQRD